MKIHYHSDHLGSASFVTNAEGAVVQHLQYLPYGELFVSQRNTEEFDSRYKFTAKELDNETSYTYFGARYYDSDLSVWLSVDPMSDKYPSTSAYMYCAGNPIILFDNDGNRIFIVGETSKNYVKSYLNEHFGDSKAFRITYSGELKVNNRRYEKFYNSATDDQKMLMSGLKEAINLNEIAEIHINKESNNFRITQTDINQDGLNMEYFRNYTTDKEALIQPPFKTIYTTFKKYYILINNERADNEE